MQTPIASVVLSSAPSDKGLDLSEEDVASWIAFARECIGELFPEVIVTTKPTAGTEIVCADPSWRDELRERVSDAWHAWCLGERVAAKGNADADGVARDETDAVVRAAG